MTHPQVRKRKLAGVDSINIAPQLGYVHSCVLSKLGYHYERPLSDFKNFVLEQETWKKWVVDGVDDPEIKFLVSAHYYFNSDSAKLIKSIINDASLPLYDMIYDEISVVLDQYRLGYGE